MRKLISIFCGRHKDDEESTLTVWVKFEKEDGFEQSHSVTFKAGESADDVAFKLHGLAGALQNE